MQGCTSTQARALVRIIARGQARASSSLPPTVTLPDSPWTALPPTLAAVRVPGRGRALVAAAPAAAGAALMTAQPLAALLDAERARDGAHCSACFTRVRRGAGRTCDCGLVYCSTECLSRAMGALGHGALCGPAAAALAAHCAATGANFPRVAAALLARSLAGDGVDFVQFWSAAQFLVTLPVPPDADDVPPAWAEGYGLVRAALSAHMDGDSDAFWGAAFDLRTYARLMGTLRLNSFAVTVAGDDSDGGGVGEGAPRAGAPTTLAWAGATAPAAGSAAAAAGDAGEASRGGASAAGAPCGDTLDDCGSAGACSPAHFREPAGGGTALFGSLSLCNHSCDPSAAVVMYPGGGVALTALRQLAPGDEVTLSYVDVSLGPGARRPRLLHGYGFECDCRRCAAGL